MALILLYYTIHLPFDINMVRKRSEVGELRDYGYLHYQALGFFIEAPSLLMWLAWISLGLFRWDKQFRSSSILFLPDATGFVVLSFFGLLAMITAVFVAIWVRITRGKYGISWGLNENIPFLDSGPYRYVRHPTYLFYCLMFLAIPLYTAFWPLLILIAGIYGYNRVIELEEKLLIAHYGAKYESYRNKTGKLLPRIFS